MQPNELNTFQKEQRECVFPLNIHLRGYRGPQAGALGAMPATLQTAHHVWSLVSLGLSVPRPPALKSGIVGGLSKQPWQTAGAQ